MKTAIAILLGVLFLYSCQKTNTGKIRMDKFVQESRSSFIKSDLTFYSYDPRVKFQYNSDSVVCRFFIRPDNKLLISVWTDKKYYGLIKTVCRT